MSFNNIKQSSQRQQVTNGCTIKKGESLLTHHVMNIPEVIAIIMDQTNSRSLLHAPNEYLLPTANIDILKSINKAFTNTVNINA